MPVLRRLDPRRHPVAWLLLAVVLALAALWQLERARQGIETRPLTAGGTPGTVYLARGREGPAPLVVVAHGFAGSRQLM
jgi:poly(3-hydroxybutyrate) depolymerase